MITGNRRIINGNIAIKKMRHKKIAALFFYGAPSPDHNKSLLFTMIHNNEHKKRRNFSRLQAVRIRFWVIKIHYGEL